MLKLVKSLFNGDEENKSKVFAKNLKILLFLPKEDKGLLKNTSLVFTCEKDSAEEQNFTNCLTNFFSIETKNLNESFFLTDLNLVIRKEQLLHPDYVNFYIQTEHSFFNDKQIESLKNFDESLVKSKFHFSDKLKTQNQYSRRIKGMSDSELSLFLEKNTSWSFLPEDGTSGYNPGGFRLQLESSHLKKRFEYLVTEDVDLGEAYTVIQNDDKNSVTQLQLRNKYSLRLAEAEQKKSSIISINSIDENYFYADDVFSLLEYFKK